MFQAACTHNACQMFTDMLPPSRRSALRHAFDFSAHLAAGPMLSITPAALSA